MLVLQSEPLLPRPKRMNMNRPDVSRCPSRNLLSRQRRSAGAAITPERTLKLPEIGFLSVDASFRNSREDAPSHFIESQSRMVVEQDKGGTQAIRTCAIAESVGAVSC
jgi:hypothetical protein